jgi:hypothetical protein
MRHFPCGAFPGTGPPQIHSLYYADANEFEKIANEEFLLRMEQMFGFCPPGERESRVKVFVDVI